MIIYCSVTFKCGSVTHAEDAYRKSFSIVNSSDFPPGYINSHFSSVQHAMPVAVE
jgi:hypothetical protein